ncbi:hypothetical protein PFICI_02631 [Pestalotiopsis fici W106-1]|uniref:Isotrichodermin C-15 hydroxylase n=1 Tax=Pestalotiopsis fici (strain W106-1 / CGMCC3.15140) TaxID=1229662 RepID=W3XHA1_PESFW|nr:uncharacterized protein PFICI_02631 [Pestalotiopsis fici W106-1]ETS84606.1 hypothetical protein PFICI_02631 [Pestalotiopsis fici W106-1]
MGLIYAVARAAYNLWLHPLRHYPGPRLSAASGIPTVLMILRGQPHKEIANLHDQYGEIVRIGPNELSFVNAEAWENIFDHRKAGQGENVKDPAFAAPFSGNIIGAGRDDHRRMRRLLSHGFSAQKMSEQQPLIRQYIDLLIRRVREVGEQGSKAVDMVSWFNWTTFDIIGDLAFGEPFGCLENSGYHPWVAAIFSAVKVNTWLGLVARYPSLSSSLALFIPKSMKEGAEAHDNLTRLKVDKRLSLKTSRPDFVDAMLSKGDLSMTKEEIYDNAGLLIGAGSETTATALSAATFFLTMHPNVLQKLTQEIRTSFESEDAINIQGVQKLDYMLAVLDETMRLHPPPPVANLRQACPGGTRIGVWHWAMFRNPNNFLLPNSFIPERWLGDKRFINDNKQSFQPFSYGPRNCIGKNLAYVEMRIIMARLIWNFDMFLAEESCDWLEKEEVYTLWHKGPLYVKMKPRLI